MGDLSGTRNRSGQDCHLVCTAQQTAPCAKRAGRPPWITSSRGNERASTAAVAAVDDSDARIVFDVRSETWNKCVCKNLTLLVLQSRFGDKLPRIRLVLSPKWHCRLPYKGRDLNEERFSVFFQYFSKILVFSYRKKTWNTEISGKMPKKKLKNSPG